MIHVKNLTKYYSGSQKPALDNISFTVEKGEIVGLLGENGAGKTTTLRILATTLSPGSGTAEIDKFSITREPAKARSRTGVLFGGETALYDRLTCRENILYFARLYGIPKREAERRLEALTAELEMEAFINRRSHEFSKGMKQKTAIARSIIHDPEIMLFDEPTSGLDLRASRVIYNFMERYRDRGKAILFSSHNINEVKRICGRVLILHRGMLVEKERSARLFSMDPENFENGYLKIIGNDDQDH
jgi:sodium transport system ATP-binding protein